MRVRQDEEVDRGVAEAGGKMEREKRETFQPKYRLKYLPTVREGFS